MYLYVSACQHQTGAGMASQYKTGVDQAKEKPRGTGAPRG
jgi:hypothetical protein